MNEVNILTLESVGKKYGLGPREALEMYSEIRHKTREEWSDRLKALTSQPSESGDLHTGNTIRTFKGNYVDVFSPDAATIDIEDIAHGLSNTCRFGGHTYNFYSVGQHSVSVSRHQLVPDDLKMTALLHDATEAYMCDMPRPIKRNLSEYKRAEDNLMLVIANKFGIEFPFPDIIKTIDRLQLEIEHEHIMIKKNYACLSPMDAKAEFLYYYKLYTDTV